jgi:hypothetical protein
MNFAELQIGGIQPKVADLANQLLIIEPIEYKANIDTVHGMTDAIEVNVTNLDTGQIHEGILFFNVALKNALKNKVGQKVLARIGQGTAKPGKVSALDPDRCNKQPGRFGKGKLVRGCGPCEACGSAGQHQQQIRNKL